MQLKIEDLRWHEYFRNGRDHKVPLDPTLRVGGFYVISFTPISLVPVVL